MTHRVKQGDRTTVTFTVRSPSPAPGVLGAPQDITGYTPHVVARSRQDPSAPTITLASSIADPTAGQIVHELDGTLEPDTYVMEVELVKDGKPQTAPSRGRVVLVVEPALAPPPST